MIPEFAMEPWRLAIYMGIAFIAGSCVTATTLCLHDLLASREKPEPEKEPTSVKIDFPIIGCRSNYPCEWKDEG